MPYITGEATSVYDILEAIDDFVVTQIGWVRLDIKKHNYRGNTKYLI